MAYCVQLFGLFFFFFFLRNSFLVYLNNIILLDNNFIVGRNKKANFNYIKERVWKKIQGWKEKLLSQAYREVLIKAVVKQSPHILWAVSNSVWVFVRKLKVSLGDFGGVKMEIEGRFIGSSGLHFAKPRMRVEWASKT